MLAQNFKTATDLGITDAELDALIKVLGMLERDELPHLTDIGEDGAPDSFRMSGYRNDTSCGTVACIAGWVSVVMKEPRGFACTFSSKTSALDELCHALSSDAELDDITPAQAAIALRSYLTTGEANWADTLASA